LGKLKRYIGDLIIGLLMACLASANVRAGDSVFLEELTSFEVRSLIATGSTTIILPTGGTEQNGPHMVLGKHNIIVKYAAEQIALKLGKTLVAPVLAYVPEGSIDPPTGHMKFAGTISLPEEYFAKVIEFAARSFKASGFRDIVLIGDSGPNQNALKSVAMLLNKEWQGSQTRAHFASDYYNDRAYVDWLRRQGESTQAIGTHAGIADTSQLMALYPKGIRQNHWPRREGSEITGVSGDPSRAKVEYGRKGLALKIDQAVNQVQRMILERRD
jgi:creatinine amidohydrolase